jgi:hypothetical protein
MGVPVQFVSPRSNRRARQPRLSFDRAMPFLAVLRFGARPQPPLTFVEDQITP